MQNQSHGQRDILTILILESLETILGHIVASCKFTIFYFTLECFADPY